jgi:putative ABC transport system permease protein
MFKNYSKIAWRNLTRNRAFSFTNLLGLTIGITCTILILLWVQNELSWNKFQPNYNTTYQVIANRNFNGQITTDGALMLPLAKNIEAQFPQVKNAAFTTYGSEGHVLTYGDKKLKQNALRVSEHYFNIFPWHFIKGNAANAMTTPDALILTQSAAKSLFGNEEAMGKVVKLDNNFDVKVTGVIEDVPEASSIQFDFITPFNYDPQAAKDWMNCYTNLFIQTQGNVDEAALGKEFTNMVKKHDPNVNGQFFLHPMSKWRLYSDFKDGKNVGGQIEYVKLFTIIAIIILLIACVNFMNLSTARSEKRAKEVGIRKTLGSAKVQLMLQFFTESMILTFAAFLLSICCVYVLLPAFNNMVDKHLALDLNDATFWITGFAILLFTGILAGSYPAIYLSSFSPVKVLKGTFLPGKKAAMPRRVLVVLQFIISILLISSTIVIYQQIQHVKNRDIGYNPNNLIMIPASSPDVDKNYNVIKQELLKTGIVKSVTGSTAPVTAIYNYSPAPDYAGKPANTNMIVAALGVTDDYAKTIGEKMVQGSDFKGLPADSGYMILNEAAVKTMGLKNPIGMKMSFFGRDYTLSGIAANIVMADPYKPVDPLMILYRPVGINFVSIRLNEGVQPQQALRVIENIFKTYNPGFPFEYQFADQEFGKKFITEDLIGKISFVFAALAIFICCLGLAGLASFTIEKRFREIGVRKVLGASIQQLLLLISKEFLKLVGIAFLIAVPLTWWAMTNWLQHYDYCINISIWLFAVVGVLVLLLTLIIVSLNTFKAAVANPVKSLRTE